MDAQDVAERVLSAWRDAASNGDWSGVVALLADDVCVTMPFKERWRGEHHGVDEARELFRHAADDVQVRLDQRLVSPLLGNGQRFSVELVGTGTLGGKPAKVPVCLCFTVLGDRITVIREYLGDPA